MSKFIKTKENADCAYRMFDYIKNKRLSKEELVMIIEAAKRNEAELTEIIESKENLLQLSLLTDKIANKATEINKSLMFNQICYEEFKLTKKSAEYADRIDLKEFVGMDAENRRYGFQQGAIEMLGFIIDNYLIKNKRET